MICNVTFIEPTFQNNKFNNNNNNNNNNKYFSGSYFKEPQNSEIHVNFFFTKLHLQRRK